MSAGGDNPKDTEPSGQPRVDALAAFPVGGAGFRPAIRLIRIDAIVGSELRPSLKLRPTGARDLFSVGPAEEEGRGEIACEQAAYVDHPMIHLDARTMVVRLHGPAFCGIGG